MTTPRCGLLFHFTHVDNLATVVAEGALLSDSAVEAQGCLTVEAGSPAIKSRRRQRLVPCGPRGAVGDYVPFYFAARSPMMYQIARGGVPTFAGDHRDLVYIVSDVEQAIQAGLRFVISDRNAAVAVADFKTDPAVLGELNTSAPRSEFIDWGLMQAQWWQDTAEAPDRMERRMAEFLVLDRFPLDLCLVVAVHSATQRDKVEQVFAGAGWSIPVEIQPSWYYA